MRGHQTLACGMVLGIAWAALLASAEEKEAPKEATPQQIEKLIAQLGSEQFQEREGATAALKALGKTAQAAMAKTAADTKDEEVRTRLKKLLLYLNPNVTLATLAADERDIATLPFNTAIDEDGKRAGYQAYGSGDYGVHDIGTIRVAVQGSPFNGRSSSKITINASDGGTSSSSMGFGGGMSFSFKTAGGVTQCDLAGIKFTITNGVMEIAGQKLAFEKTAKVIFLDSDGKLKKVYDAAKEETPAKK